MKGRALIVGAGIGGLAAARALRRAGLEVQILERAPSLEAIGAAISLWPNATRLLPALGVGAELVAEGTLPAGGIHRMDGRQIANADPREIESRYGSPLLLLHRSALLRALLADGVEDMVETGAEIARVEENGERVRAETADGRVHEAELLIAADGIQSTVRSDLWNDGPPRQSGLLAYRAIVEWSGPLGPGEYWGPGFVFGLAPVEPGRVYWYATRRTVGGEPPEENPIPSLLERFAEWAPEISEAIGATPPAAVLRHDLFDRPGGTSWVRDRVALLGDAAHPMLPFLGQGACQAIEDADALGAALEAGAEIPAALQAYERARRKRAERVVRMSRRVGNLIHLRSAPLRALRNRAMSLTPEGVRMRQLDSVVGPA